MKEVSSDLPDILFNAKPLIKFAYLGFLPAWLSVIIYAVIIKCWYKSLRKYQKSHNNKDLLLLIAEPLIIVSFYIISSIIIGWHMYFMGIIIFIILIVGGVIIPAFIEYSNKYPKHSTEMVRAVFYDLRHPIIFLMHDK